ncbi:transketolase [Pseudopelagicola sp. nBUS_20]|uniref:transketolase n=1 Tax=Pseudopelagicola sp. nBUS_20 TaxID=3395317 RepID=UPI003EB93696
MNIQSPAIDERVMANAIRALAMDAVQAANSGHPGMPMGMADVATVLFNRFINLNPANHEWPNRDRFVLSAGHGSMLLYAINHLLGYDDMGMDQIRSFRQLGSRTAGHPEYGHAKGIEMTTGPLGQGLATSVGMALSERMGRARFPDLIDHRTYVIVGDGCLMEGVSHEAIDIAGHLGLGNLIVLWDDNRITIDGDVGLTSSTNQLARFDASGWHVVSCDGHNTTEIGEAIEAAQSDTRPTLIACRTTIGFGAPNKQGSHSIHGAPLGVDEIAAARANLGWTHEPFEIPEGIYAAWSTIAKRGASNNAEWTTKLSKSPHKKTFNAHLAQGITPLNRAMTAYKEKLANDKPKVATRKASEMALNVLNNALPFSVGGSADLTGSNLTRTTSQKSVTKDNFDGSYIHYGVREFGMSAAMNGIALSGLFRPYGGTFLVFADYARPAIRLAALMKIPTTFVMTHDSIGLGEDGPTHQPVETIAGLRAMPNLTVLRPCDAVETAEAWEIAASSQTTPVLMALSRQAVPLARQNISEENLTARGAYVLRDASHPQVTLIATGSEVKLALDAAKILAAINIEARVVSAPSFELFAAQDAKYQAKVLGQAPRIGIEAAVQQGWDTLLRPSDAFVGMTDFGTSAPAEELYQYFGITAQAVVALTKSMI